MRRVIRSVVLTAAFAATVPTATASAEGRPRADHRLSPQIVGQWIVMMTSLLDLTRSDPALAQRLRQEKYALADGEAGSDVQSRGFDLEKIARDEPKVRAAISRSGMKASEATGITTACIAAAMTSFLRQRGMPANPAAQVPQENLAAVKPRHPEIMGLIRRIQESRKPRSGAP